MTARGAWDSHRHRADLRRTDRTGRRDQPAADELVGDTATARRALADAHHDYTTSIAPLGLTVSLQTAAVLATLAERTDGAILDAGPGFSTYALATRRADTLISVGGTLDRRNKTLDFIARHGAPKPRTIGGTQLLAGLPPLALAFVDLGDPDGARAYHLAGILDALAPGGIAVLDDTHQPACRHAAEWASQERGLRLLSLRTATLDEYGRWASLVVKPA